jgi:hypothetical protein
MEIYAAVGMVGLEPAFELLTTPPQVVSNLREREREVLIQGRRL